MSLSRVLSKTSGSSTSSSHSREGRGVGVDECEADVVGVDELLLKKLNFCLCLSLFLIADLLITSKCFLYVLLKFCEAFYISFHGLYEYF